MAIRFGQSQRGGGKIYVSLSCDVPAGGSMHARSTAGNGQDLPAQVVATPKRGAYVLVVPQLRLEQVVSVFAEDAFGAVVEAQTYRVDARVSSLSTWQGARRQIGLEDARNCDRIPCVDTAWVSVERLFGTAGGVDVIHGVVEAYVPKGVPEGEVDITVLDGMGQPAHQEPFILLDTEREPLSNGATIWRIQYSAKVPRALGHFIVWAQFSERLVRDGFCCVEPGRALALRDEWARTVYSSGMSPAYHEWFLERGRASDRTLAIQRGTELPEQPTFSIVVPLFHTKADVFDEMADSVFSQTYPHWELIFVNATPEEERLSAQVAERAKNHRVKVINLGENGGIAENTNTGIRQATGDFVGLLDHDDLLTPDCLFRYAQGLAQRPETDLFYCDEDSFLHGRYSQGFFKPDYDHEYLMARDYIRHFLCVRRDLLAEMDAEGELPGASMDAAYGHALCLKVTERARNVFHVRSVLYHTRLHERDEVSTRPPRAEWEVAELACVRAHVEREGFPATVERLGEVGANLVRYHANPERTVSLVVSHAHNPERLAACLEALEPTLGPHVALTVADTGGRGWGEARNAAARETSGEVIVFLDAVCTPLSDDWLTCLLGPLERSGVAVTGAKILYADGLIHHSGICIPKSAPRYTSHLFPDTLPGVYGLIHLPHGVSAVTGSCLAVKREDFERVGGFDEDLTLGLADVDFCLRLREERRDIVMAPQARLEIEMAARRGRVMPHARYGRPDAPEDPKVCERLRLEEGIFMGRWTDYLSKGDRFYNPNFLPAHCHYQIV